MTDEQREQRDETPVEPLMITEGTLCYYVCGACKKKVLNLKYDACPKCGKRIDWKDVRP